MTAIDETRSTSADEGARLDLLPPKLRSTRIERARMPFAVDVVEDVAIQHGVCIRPVALRVTDTRTGEVQIKDVPCGATMEAKCPPCATRWQRLRMHQCREGWHAETDPIPEPDPSTAEQQTWVEIRADVTATRDDLLSAGDELGGQDCQETLDEIDAYLVELGVRGRLEAATTADGNSRRGRSTRRRQDAPDLPKRAMLPTTIGRTFTGNGGRVFRPSMFITLTLPSYGKVDPDTGAPRDPGVYDINRQARDHIAFGRLCDRFFQNLRRVAGFDVQYFGTVEPQRRLAPHLHVAIRGSIPRALLKQVIAATYHQVWWPSTDEIIYDGTSDRRGVRLPVWDDHAGPDQTGGYLDPDTGAELPTWDEALDAMDKLHDLYASTGNQQEIQPRHVTRFGTQADIQGLISGTPEADRRITYVAKYLTKDIVSCHDDTAHLPEVRAHIDRLVDALRFEPCSPTCANWLRYGIQPKNTRDGLTPGACKGKAHQRQHLGYAGRRVLVSRKWSGKTLADHRAERRTYVLDLLGITTDQIEDGDGQTGGDKTAGRYLWEPLDPAHTPPLTTRLLHAIAQRSTWRRQYDAALKAAGPPGKHQVSATESAA